ncbi:MAG: SusC/RagA family TonB-linked outer membrane protein [Microscillaceae bacterium]|nr:SusC/RagA family TonB-linked outer membrane protein [Microscillaceae bacterium]
MKHKLLWCFVVSLLITCVSFAQETKITGVVTDTESGEPLPGVSVAVKGTSTGTVTDVEGKYSIMASQGATLVFSSIGMETQEVVVGTSSEINLAMAASTKELGELLVTAQGIERSKNELPYAAQKIDGQDISYIRDPNLVNSLSGRVAGVDIKRNNSLGGSTNIVIRGVKSLTGNNQALFVVDGVPIDNSNTNGGNQSSGRGGYDYGNAAADINPDDIASINVLKGAAATVLYGSRASNGVVLITTKKGTKSKGIGITINTGVTFGTIDKNTFVEYQDQYGQGYGGYYEDPSGFFLYRDINEDGIDDLVTPTSEDASWGARFDPSLQVYQWDAFDPSSPNFGKPRPWVAAANDPTTFFNDYLATSNNIALETGNEKGWIKIAYTKSIENGILPNSRLSKDFVNFSASYNLTDKLSVSVLFNPTFIKGEGRYGTGYDDKNVATNFRQWWPVNVDINDLKGAYERTGKNVTWNWADPSNLTPIYWDNPYWTRFENYQNDNRLRYFGYASVNYKVADWFDITGRFSIDSYSELQEERYAVGSLSPSQYARYNRNFREYNYDLILNFNKKFGENFSIRGLLGGNIRRTIIETIYASTNGGLVVPNLYSLSNSLNPVNPPTETYSQLEVDGVYANAILGYKSLVFLDLAVRRDVASSLPKSNNAYYYPSASLSFVFSELIGTNDWLTNAKLRVNYAEVGNTADPYRTLDVYDKPTAFGSVPLFSIPGTKNNPDLKPERTRSFEVGLEMSFLDARVGFDVTYYKQNTIDQILPAAISTATGYNSKYINAGNVQNQGVELIVFGTPVKAGDFTWTINANWTRNRNKVIELAPGIDNLLLATFQGGVSINAALNEPYGTIRGQNFVYDDNGQKVVLASGFYKRSATSNEIIGNANPDWLAGISNTLSYKNLSLSFLIDIRKGGDIFNLDLYYGLATGASEMTVGNNDLGNPIRNSIADGGGLIFPGVKEDGTPNDTRVSLVNFGTLGYQRNPAAGFIYDGSYVKLRQLAITYSIPQSIVSKIGLIKGIDISLLGRNLWIIHKNLPYGDPEDTINSGNLQGYQGGMYPTTRNFGFNVKLKF